jgi:16S rRNA processing protein RimM
LKEVYLFSEEEAGWEQLETYRFHKGRVILKFRGRERAHEVQDLLGREVQVPDTDRVKLPADTYFDSDLVNCRVFEGNALLGQVVGLLKAGADSVNLVVANLEGREILVPLVKEFVKEIDLEGATIVVDLPPGLAELSVDSSRPSEKKSGKARKRR